MARLSVNLNKIALLRNARHTGVPDVVAFARAAIEAGAGGITVHPRPDERHIRRADVPALAALLADTPIELNVEGYPDARLLHITVEVRPAQCTLVPDAPDVFTSDKGWDLDGAQMAVAGPAIATLKAIGARVILFVDPDPEIVPRVARAGADGIEIYTGGYAEAFRVDGRGHAAWLDAYAATAEAARAAGLVVNVGHDLNLRNIPPLLARIGFLAEASIGHELTADALTMGWSTAVAAYVAALAGT